MARAPGGLADGRVHGALRLAHRRELGHADVPDAALFRRHRLPRAAHRGRALRAHGLRRAGGAARPRILLVVVFVALLAFGMPVAFSMAIATIAGFLVLEIPLETVAQKMLSGIEPFPFVAIPLFVLAGALMETSGISRRLVALASAIVGHIRGGLGIVVVASEVLFSGISGSSVADASAIGSILIPSLVKAGYPPERAAAIVAAASGMGILIPP